MPTATVRRRREVATWTNACVVCSTGDSGTVITWGQRLGEWSSKYGSGATKKKVYVAKGIKYFDKIGVAEFEMESGSLKVGDEILITGPTTGAVMQTIEEIRVDLKPVDETVKGERFSFKVNEKIRPSDRLYKMEKVQLEKVFE